MQVFGPYLRNGCFGLGFGRSGQRPKPEALAELQMACQLAHLHYCEIVPPAQRVQGPSLREREPVTWIARGKSNSVIAEILALSTHTVDAHRRRIFTKLGVTDRTTAAIRGIGSGLIRGEV